MRRTAKKKQHVQCTLYIYFKYHLIIHVTNTVLYHITYHQNICVVNYYDNNTYKLYEIMIEKLNTISVYTCTVYSVEMEMVIGYASEDRDRDRQRIE